DGTGKIVRDKGDGTFSLTFEYEEAEMGQVPDQLKSKWLFLDDGELGDDLTGEVKEVTNKDGFTGTARNEIGAFDEKQGNRIDASVTRGTPSGNWTTDHRLRLESLPTAVPNIDYLYGKNWSGRLLNGSGSGYFSISKNGMIWLFAEGSAVRGKLVQLPTMKSKHLLMDGYLVLGAVCGPKAQYDWDGKQWKRCQAAIRPNLCYLVQIELEGKGAIPASPTICMETGYVSDENGKPKSRFDRVYGPPIDPFAFVATNTPSHGRSASPPFFKFFK
ncbi:hypothetical protein OAH18_00665, partial [bacterium]|nr:hypothetical protein [bacterium]